jgi:hypothetical protein
MQAWYVYVLYSLVGITLWLILKNIPRLKAITLFGVPCLAVILIYYSVNAYASRGETLFIGILLYMNAGEIGNIVYAISITSFMALSESAKRIPYGTLLLVLVPYFITFIPKEYAGSFLANLIIWIATLAGSIGYLNLFVDLILCLRWEFLSPGESHA